MVSVIHSVAALSDFDQFLATLSEGLSAEDAARLRAAVAAAGRPPEPKDAEEEAERAREPVVGLSQRAWPLMDMLERTAMSRGEAHVVWEAAAPF